MQKQIFPKRALSILLAIVLIVTSVGALTIHSSATESPSLITNGDFSDGLNGWSVTKHTVTDDVTTSTEAGNTVAVAKSGHILSQKVSLVAGTTYHFFFRTKFSGTTFSNSGFYRAGVLKAEPTQLTGASFCDSSVISSIEYWVDNNNRYYPFADKQPNKTEWKMHYLSFKAVADAEVYLAIGSFFGAATDAEYCIDDVAFTAAVDMITNGDFANNDLTGFSTRQNGGSGSCSFTPNGENDYYLSAAQGLAFYKKVILEANTSYTMSFDFRFTGTVTTNDSFYRAGFVLYNNIDLGGASFDAVGGDYVNNLQYYSIYANQRTQPNLWKTHSFTFTPTADTTVYAVVGSYNASPGSDFELDNWSLYKTSDLVTVTTVAESGGTVSGAVDALKGTLATLTATPNKGYIFAGWYDAEGTLVSSEADYQHLVTAAETLTAKFEIDPNVAVSNYLRNGDFETDVTFPSLSEAHASQEEMAANSGKWGRVASGVTRMDLTTVTNENGTDENGTRFLTSGSTLDSNAYIRSFGQFVYLPVGTYCLTFIAKSNYDGFYYGVYREPIVPPGENGTFLVREKLNISEEWTTYCVTFTVTEAKYYEVAFGVSENGNAGKEFSIDNVVLQKVMNTAYESKAAVRTKEASSTGKQGMRVYNRINKTYATDVTEYGSLAIRKGYLASVQKALNTEETLSLALYDQFDAAYSGAPGMGKGVSYNGTNHITYLTTNIDYVFTSYLTGIDPKYYGDTYLIRTYAKTGDEVLYGETFEISIFDVVYTILEIYKETSGEGYNAAMQMIEDAKNTAGATTYAEWFAANHSGKTSVVAE